MEAGKKRLVGDTSREATSDEVSDLRKENLRLKELVAELMLRSQVSLFLFYYFKLIINATGHLPNNIAF